MPQLSYSRVVVEEGLSVVGRDAPDFRQAFDHTIKRITSSILPTAQAAGYIASTTSGESIHLLLPLAHRASDAIATRLASGLEGRAAARPPFHTTYTAAIPREQTRDRSFALKTMRTESVARCPATLMKVAAIQETFLKTCQKN